MLSKYWLKKWVCWWTNEWMGSQPGKYLFHVTNIDSSLLNLSFCLRNGINCAWWDSVMLDKVDLLSGSSRRVGKKGPANSTRPLLTEFTHVRAEPSPQGHHWTDPITMKIRSQVLPALPPREGGRYSFEPALPSCTFWVITGSPWSALHIPGLLISRPEPVSTPFTFQTSSAPCSDEALLRTSSSLFLASGWGNRGMEGQRPSLNPKIKSSSR